MQPIRRISNDPSAFPSGVTCASFSWGLQPISVARAHGSFPATRLLFCSKSCCTRFRRPSNPSSLTAPRPHNRCQVDSTVLERPSRGTLPNLDALCHRSVMSKPVFPQGNTGHECVNNLSGVCTPVARYVRVEVKSNRSPAGRNSHQSCRAPSSTPGAHSDEQSTNSMADALYIP